ncbi:MAG: hypothetical protein AAGN66_01475 [Acidobacteriota bacterium]
MRIATSTLLASLLSLALATFGFATAGATEIPDAGPESRALAAHLAAEYSDYLREYIHVFVGYGVCSYGFIDEDVLNDLADDSLRNMTTRASELIRDAHPRETTLPAIAVDYAASMAVLTTVEMWANDITAEIAPLYQAKDFDCAASVKPNRERYEKVQRFVAGAAKTSG